MAEPDRTPRGNERDATVREDLPAPASIPAASSLGPDQRGDMTIREAEIPRYAVQDRRSTPEPQSSKDLLSLLSVSGLRTAAEVSELVASLSADDFKLHVDLLAGVLVDRGYLTDYQVRKLLSGDAHKLVFQDFAIENMLGEGGIAKVYVARWKKTKQRVALKVVPPNDPRFDREVRAVARLAHPNVVAVLDRGAGPEGDFLAMEWVEGPDLAKYVENREKLSPGEIVHLMLQAARGVGHLHEHRIIHRDLKPQNYVLAPDGTLKLIDLGLARFDLRPSSFSGEGDNLTAEGSMLGTPSYMAPEQIKNASSADQRSDIYSLGCMLYFLTTGDRPFARFNPMETIELQLFEPPPKLRDKRSDIPAALEALYLRMMSKDPKGRPQSMEELVTALEELERATPAAPVGSSGAAKGEAGPPWMLLGVLAVPLIAGAIWWFTR